MTGCKASNLEELLFHLSQVSGSCIFYHTHHLYLAHHFEKPRFYNEFANWVSQALQEERLAERLAAIDLLAMTFHPGTAGGHCYYHPETSGWGCESPAAVPARRRASLLRG